RDALEGDEQRHVADADRVARLDLTALDADAVDEGAVLALEIGDKDPAPDELYLRVAAREALVDDADPAAGRAPDHRRRGRDLEDRFIGLAGVAGDPGHGGSADGGSVSCTRRGAQLPIAVSGAAAPCEARPPAAGWPRRSSGIRSSSRGSW